MIESVYPIGGNTRIEPAVLLDCLARSLHRPQERFRDVTRRIDHGGHRSLLVRLRFDCALFDRVKTLARRRWHAPEKRCDVPRDDVAVVDLLAPDGYPRAFARARGDET